MVFEFKDFGIHLGTRSNGANVREVIISVIKETETPIVFDFAGVETVSNSFADECFAKLVLDFPMELIKQKTTFVNATPFIKAAIANSFKARLSQLASA